MAGSKGYVSKGVNETRENQNWQWCDESKLPSWSFFRQILFLADTIKPIKMESSVPHVEENMIFFVGF